MDVIETAVVGGMRLDSVLVGKGNALHEVARDGVTGTHNAVLAESNVDSGERQAFLGVADNHEHAVDTQDIGCTIVGRFDTGVVDDAVAAAARQFLDCFDVVWVGLCVKDVISTAGGGFVKLGVVDIEANHGVALGLCILDA